jgi:hypothetical protein
MLLFLGHFDGSFVIHRLRICLFLVGHLIALFRGCGFLTFDLSVSFDLFTLLLLVDEVWLWAALGDDPTKLFVIRARQKLHLATFGSILVHTHKKV